MTRQHNTPADGYIRHKSKLATEAILTNLASAAHLPYAFGERVARELTAIVVGAGPSLEKTGPALKKAQEQGALIITVNTALSAVSKYVVPDVCVVREVVDVSGHLAHPCGLFALDLAAAPRAWEAARSASTWFVAGALQNFELAAALGVRPLFGGTSAMSAAVALAYEWGASSIMLMGVDLAFAHDGAGYAKSSAFGDFKGKSEDGKVQISGQGYEVMREQNARGGVRPPPAAQSVRHVPVNDGGPPCAQLLTWGDQQDWLETFAARHPVLDLVDIGGHARKAGWEYAAKCPDIRHPNFIPPLIEGPGLGIIERVRERTANAARSILALCSTVLAHDGFVPAVPQYLEGSDIVEAMAAGRILELNDIDLTLDKRVPAVYGVLAEAAQEVLALCTKPQSSPQL